ncbi:transposase [Sinorhizobium meliloti]|uniref:transposase n=1 Tax=Rhizobium meliloti TaxID=382 RepID=UPI0009B765E6
MEQTASFPIPRAAYASSARSPSKPTKTGWRPIATSTWTLTFFRLPRQHHKHLKSTNMLERLNEEIRRRTYVVRPARAQETRTPSSRMTSTHDRPILQNLTHTTRFTIIR